MTARHGTMGEWWISREEQRGIEHARHCEEMARQRAKPAHYADLHTGDMADPRRGDRPSALTVWTLLAVVAGGLAWPLLAIAVARIIQWSGQ